MPYYIIRLDDSDGNDNSVSDVLVGPVPAKDAALDVAWSYVKDEWPDDEDDGGFGTFHACDCACDHFVGNGQTRVVGICDRCSDTWECSHGGILLSEDPEEYATLADAQAGLATYHHHVDLTTDDATIVQEG